MTKFFAILFLAIVFAFAQAGVIVASAVVVKPTGTYTSYNFPSTGKEGYKNLSWNLTVNKDPSPGAYFYSTQFQFKKDDGTPDPSGGYFGIQTQGSNPAGKIAVFSIWDAVDSRGPGVSVSFDGEGVGRSVRISYPWIEGRIYNLRIAPMAPDGQWWGAWIRDSVNGVELFVGQIKLSIARSQLYGDGLISWTENYAVTATTCDDIEFSDVSFTDVAMNNSTIYSSSRQNYLSDPVNCTGSYSGDLINGSRQQMGNNTTQHNCVVLEKNLYFGSRGSDVVQLQNFLIAKGYLAVGDNTGLFWTKTFRAVQKLQARNGLVSYGAPVTTGYGVVGKRTRALIVAMCDIL